MAHSYIPMHEPILKAYALNQSVGHAQAALIFTQVERVLLLKEEKGAGQSTLPDTPQGTTGLRYLYKTLIHTQYIRYHQSSPVHKNFRYRTQAQGASSDSKGTLVMTVAAQ